MSTGTDRARLQTLTDAIIAAQLAGQAIPQHERVTDCSFGEFPEGGWYWEIATERPKTYGNTKLALTPQGHDYRDYNMRAIINTGMTALAREAREHPEDDRHPGRVTIVGEKPGRDFAS